MLSVVQKIELLKEFYHPLNYQGLKFNIKMNDAEPRKNWLNSIKEVEQAKVENRAVRGYKLFNLKALLKEHLCGSCNLAVVFPKGSSYIIAFDLDSKDATKFSELWETARILYRTLVAMGLIPFLYISGGKGFHCEVAFNSGISVPKLKRAVKYIMKLAVENGADPNFFDCSYPSNKTYRIFGTWHYITGLFTSAFDSNFRKLSEYDSWEYFKRLPKNDASAFEREIDNMPDIASSERQKNKTSGTKRERKNLDWSIQTLTEIYENGLKEAYTRYNTAFNLGRYFRYELNFSVELAEKAIDIWLKRHSWQLCNEVSGLKAFPDEIIKRIKTPYDFCVKETIRNCINGYLGGRRFSNKRVKDIAIKIDKSNAYVESLKLSKKRKDGLKYLINLANTLKSLSFSHSYKQFLAGWNVNSRDTVCLWLKVFNDIGVLKCVKVGTYKSKRASEYFINLPENCYERTSTG